MNFIIKQDKTIDWIFFVVKGRFVFERKEFFSHISYYFLLFSRGIKGGFVVELRGLLGG